MAEAAAAEPREPPKNSQPVSVADPTQDSRKNTLSASQRLFDEAMRANELPVFAELTREDLENENSLDYLVPFADWILQGHARTAQGEAYAPSSLESYFGSMINLMKKTHFQGAHRKDWGVEDDWIRTTKSTILRLAAADGRQGTNSDAMADIKTVPIFKKNEDSPTQLLTVVGKHGQDVTRPCYELKNFGPDIDLKTLMHKLLLQAKGDKHAHAVILKAVATFHAIGRGGEPKFLNYRNMHYILEFGATTARWLAIKQLLVKLTSFCNDLDHFETCFYFIMALYWVHGGLTRPAGKDPKGRSQSAVFYESVTHKDSSITKMVTSALKAAAPSNMKDLVCARGLRAGGTTICHLDRRISREELLARGCWSDGTNREAYSATALALILPCMYLLGGYPDPRATYPGPSVARTYPGNVQVIGWFQALLGTLYGSVDVYEFMTPTPQEVQQGSMKGRLKPMMDHVTATLLAWYPAFCRSFRNVPGGYMSLKLIQSRARAAWALQSDSTAHDRLMQIGQAIDDNWRSSVLAVSLPSADVMVSEEEMQRRYQRVEEAMLHLRNLYTNLLSHVTSRAEEVSAKVGRLEQELKRVGGILEGEVKTNKKFREDVTQGLNFLIQAVQAGQQQLPPVPPFQPPPLALQPPPPGQQQETPQEQEDQPPLPPQQEQEPQEPAAAPAAADSPPRGEAAHEEQPRRSPRGHALGRTTALLNGVPAGSISETHELMALLQDLLDNGKFSTWQVGHLAEVKPTHLDLNPNNRTKYGNLMEAVEFFVQPSERVALMGTTDASNQEKLEILKKLVRRVQVAKLFLMRKKQNWQWNTLKTELGKANKTKTLIMGLANNFAQPEVRAQLLYWKPPHVVMRPRVRNEVVADPAPNGKWRPVRVGTESLLAYLRRHLGDQRVP